jgi:hypothetical protein
MCKAARGGERSGGAHLQPLLPLEDERHAQEVGAQLQELLAQRGELLLRKPGREDFDVRECVGRVSGAEEKVEAEGGQVLHGNAGARLLAVVPVPRMPPEHHADRPGGLQVHQQLAAERAAVEARRLRLQQLRQIEGAACLRTALNSNELKVVAAYRLAATRSRGG